tara:strand:+ start:23 stop:2317 length:2295 start_codon:yes stop_codon:yes gene_type:complete
MNKYNRLGYFIGSDVHLRAQLIYDELQVEDNFVTNPGGAAEAGAFMNKDRLPRTRVQPGNVRIDSYGDSAILELQGTYLDASNKAEPSLTISRRGFNGSDGDRAGTLIFECPPDDSTEGVPIAAFNASWADVSLSYTRLAIGIKSTAKHPPIAGLETASYGRVIEGVSSGGSQIDVLLALGTGSTTTVAGDLTISGSDFTFDSVALTGIQTSGESFSNDDVSLMTSAAIQDEILSSAPAVTLAGSLDYLTISGQEITRNAIDLTADVTGVLPVANGGTGASSLTDNKLLTGTGTSAVTAEANATYDGTDFTLLSASQYKPILKLHNQNNSAESPELLFLNQRTSDASGVSANGDEAGKITFQSINNRGSGAGGPEDITYAQVKGSIFDNTDGGEDGRLALQVAESGSLTTAFDAYGSGFGTINTFGNGGLLSYSNFDSTLVFFTSSVSTAPTVSISNYANDATGPTVTLGNYRGGISGGKTDGSDSDVCGTINFNAYDDGTPTATNFAKIEGIAKDVSDGAEEGKLTLSVASHDGEIQPGLTIESGDAEDEVDVTIGNGSTSLTTIAGAARVTSGLQVGGEIELGSPATDTTLARSAAGTVTIEGNQIVTAGAVSVASEAQAPISTMVARRTITQAEANNMHSTPIEIVPAQGANTVIIPLGGMVRIDRATTQSQSACDWNMHYADQEPGTYGTTSIQHIRRFMYNETGDRIFHITPGIASSEVAQSLTQDTNKAVEVSFDSAATTNAFTGIDVYLTYYVISIS